MNFENRLTSNSDQFYTKNTLLTEGGVAGHLSHIYDNYELSFAQIKHIFNKAAQGDLEGTEKTDGFNIFLTFRNGQARATRNKTDIRRGGMTLADLMARPFAGGDDVKNVFIEAFRTFEKAVYLLSEEDIRKIFGPDGNIYYNVEIQGPSAENVISYDAHVLSIHRSGHGYFDRNTGEKVESVDVEESSQHLNNVLDRIQNEMADEKFKVQRTAIIKLKGLTDDKYLKTALQRLNNEMSKYELTDHHTIGDYLKAQIKKAIIADFDEAPEGFLDIAVNSVVGDGSLRDIPNGTPRELRSFMSKYGKSKKNARELMKKAIWPLEDIIHDFSIQLLEGLESAYILDNKAELGRLQQQVETAVKAIQSYQGPHSEIAQDILHKQLSKMKHIDNISTVVEGFVFEYDGYLYKFTGNFAPINQLLGLYKWGRGPVPRIAPPEGSESDGDLEEGIVGMVPADAMAAVPDAPETPTSGPDAPKPAFAVIPGGFKPPHAGHFEMVNEVAELQHPSGQYLVKEIHVLISPKARTAKFGSNEIQITAEESLRIWQMYAKNNPRIKPSISSNASPVRATYEFMEKMEEGSILVVARSDKDINDKRFAGLQAWSSKNQLGVEVKDVIVREFGQNISGTELRMHIAKGDDQAFMDALPSHMSTQEQQQVWDIVAPNDVETLQLQERDRGNVRARARKRFQKKFGKERLDEISYRYSNIADEFMQRAGRGMNRGLSFDTIFDDKNRLILDMPSEFQDKMAAIVDTVESYGYDLDLSTGNISREFQFEIPAGPRQGEIISKKQEVSLGKFLRKMSMLKDKLEEAQEEYISIITKFIKSLDSSSGIKERIKNDIYDTHFKASIDQMAEEIYNRNSNVELARDIYKQVMMAVLERGARLMIQMAVGGPPLPDAQRIQQGFRDKINLEPHNVAELYEKNMNPEKHVVENMGRSYQGFVKIFQLAYNDVKDSWIDDTNSPHRIPTEGRDKEEVQSEYYSRSSILDNFYHAFKNSAGESPMVTRTDWEEPFLGLDLANDSWMPLFMESSEEVKTSLDKLVALNDKIDSSMNDEFRYRFKSFVNTNFESFIEYWNENSEQFRANPDFGQENQYSVVLSRHPIDVLRMSDFENLESCHSAGSAYFQCAIAESQGHGPIAYIVENDQLHGVNFDEHEFQNGEVFTDLDRGIRGLTPISRLRVRKYVKDNPSSERGEERGNYKGEGPIVIPVTGRDKKVQNMRVAPKDISYSLLMNIIEFVDPVFYKNIVVGKSRDGSALEHANNIISQWVAKHGEYLSLNLNVESLSYYPEEDKFLHYFDKFQMNYKGRVHNIPNVSERTYSLMSDEIRGFKRSIYNGIADIDVLEKGYTFNSYELAIPETNIYGEDVPYFYDTLRDFLFEKQAPVVMQNENISNSDDLKNTNIGTEFFRRYGGTYSDTNHGKLWAEFFGNEDYRSMYTNKWGHNITDRTENDSSLYGSIEDQLDELEFAVNHAARRFDHVVVNIHTYYDDMDNGNEDYQIDLRIHIPFYDAELVEKYTGLQYEDIEWNEDVFDKEKGEYRDMTRSSLGDMHDALKDVLWNYNLEEIEMAIAHGGRVRPGVRNGHLELELDVAMLRTDLEMDEILELVEGTLADLDGTYSTFIPECLSKLQDAEWFKYKKDVVDPADHLRMFVHKMPLDYLEYTNQAGNYVFERTFYAGDLLYLPSSMETYVDHPFGRTNYSTQMQWYMQRFKDVFARFDDYKNGHHPDQGSLFESADDNRELDVNINLVTHYETASKENDEVTNPVHSSFSYVGNKISPPVGLWFNQLKMADTHGGQTDIADNDVVSSASIQKKTPVFFTVTFTFASPLLRSNQEYSRKFFQFIKWMDRTKLSFFKELFNAHMQLDNAYMMYGIKDKVIPLYDALKETQQFEKIKNQEDIYRNLKNGSSAFSDYNTQVMAAMNTISTAVIVKLFAEENFKDYSGMFKASMSKFKEYFDEGDMKKLSVFASDASLVTEGNVIRGFDISKVDPDILKHAVKAERRRSKSNNLEAVFDYVISNLMQDENYYDELAREYDENDLVETIHQEDGTIREISAAGGGAVAGHSGNVWLDKEERES